MKKLSYLFVLFTISTFSQSYINVADITEYKKAIKEATPGTTIILGNGVWKDVKLEAYGKGTKEQPITIKAKKAGEVLITGDSQLEIYGEHIIVEGLWFKDGNPTGETIVSFKKNNEEYAKNCRFTNNAITYYNPTDENFKNHWIGLWGKNNRVDNNEFTGKKNEGTTLVVWLKGDQHTENNHRIDSNLFGARANSGKKSGETIRIGTTSFSNISSKTIVENNTFKNCDADLEVLSNKSCDNIYRGNLFLEVKGSLTLSHGDNALVENNVFLGNNKHNTGGIRIGNKNQTVRNNLFVGVKGNGNRAPIVLMYAISNSSLKETHQVDGADIQNNTLIDCSTMEFAANKSAKKTLGPINTVFANNLVKNKISVKGFEYSDDIEGVDFRNNIIETPGEFNRYLFKKGNIDWTELNSIPMPKASNEVLISDFSNPKSPTKDILGQDRSSITIGAFNLGSEKLPNILNNESGVSWDTKVVVEKFTGKVVVVEPGEGTLQKALKVATTNTKLLLKDGFYYVSKEQRINGNITIEGNKKTIIKSKYKIEKPFKSFFKVNGDSKLTLKNITLDGEVNTVKYAIVSPSKGEAAPYSLFIDNCIIKNFKHEYGYIFKAYTNTIADNISIKNSYFQNAYRGLIFHSKESVSINVRNISIENTVFKDIESFAVKYAKPESVAKGEGKLLISNCVFSNVANTEKGNVIYLKNIDLIDIKNSVFEQSEKIVTTLNLTGAKNSIHNCLVYYCGDIKTTQGATQKNIITKKPKWSDKVNFTPNKKSPLLKENNKIDRIGVL